MALVYKSIPTLIFFEQKYENYHTYLHQSATDNLIFMNPTRNFHFLLEP